MTKRVHTILCWILAISLVWLPLSVSADISLSSTDKGSCHELNAAMPGQAAVINNSMHESMMQKGCCDQCVDNCVACIGMSSCGNSSNHVSSFILFDQYSSQSLPLIQFSTQHFVQYHNQIIIPDIRPPIV